MKKKEPGPRPKKRNKVEASKKGAEEIPDPDELQALDEANEPWVVAWRKAVHGK